MKYNLLALLCSVLLLSNTVRAQENNSQTFNIEIPSKKNNVAYIAGYWQAKSQQVYIIDSVVLSPQGKGTIVYKDKPLDGQYLLVSKPDVQLDLLITKEQKEINIFVDNTNIKNCKVEGSKDTKLLWKFLLKQSNHQKIRNSLFDQISDAANESKEQEIQTRIDALDSEYDTYTKDQIQKHTGTWYSSFIKAITPISSPYPLAEKEAEYEANTKFQSKHYFDNIDLKDPRLWTTNFLDSKIETYMAQYVSPNPDSIANAASQLIQKTQGNDVCFQQMLSKFVNESQKSKIMGQENIWAKLAEEYIFDKNIAWIDSTNQTELKKQYSLLEKNRIGMTAPNLELKSINGETINTNQIEAEMLILYFYDPHCSHCAIETPKLRDEINRREKGDSIKVLAINLDSTIGKKNWQSFVEKTNLQSWIHCGDPEFKSEYWLKYDVSGTPTIYVLDKNKKIVARKIDHNGIKTIIDYYIGGKANGFN